MHTVNGLLGPQLRAFRQALGLTQEKLAPVVGVTTSTINRWEQGKAKPHGVFLRELRALGRKHGLIVGF